MKRPKLRQSNPFKLQKHNFPEKNLIWQLFSRTIRSHCLRRKLKNCVHHKQLNHGALNYFIRGTIQVQLLIQAKQLNPNKLNRPTVQ